MNTVSRMTAISILLMPPLKMRAFEETLSLMIRTNPNKASRRSIGKCTDPISRTWSIGIKNGRQQKRNNHPPSRQKKDQTARDKNREKDRWVENSAGYSTAKSEILGTLFGMHGVTEGTVHNRILRSALPSSVGNPPIAIHDLTSPQNRSGISVAQERSTGFSPA